MCMHDQFVNYVGGGSDLVVKICILFPQSSSVRLSLWYSDLNKQNVSSPSTQ